MSDDNSPNSQALYYFDPDEAIFCANTQESDFGGNDFSLPPHSQVHPPFNDESPRRGFDEVFFVIKSYMIRLSQNLPKVASIKLPGIWKRRRLMS